MPPNFRNHGNYVTSVAKLGRFLQDKAEETGAYVLSETSADKLLVEDRIVRGVRSGDKGRGKEGEELGNFEPGSDVVAKATVLAEGTLGHLTGAALDYFDLHGSNPRRWELGVKEVWEVEGAAGPRHPHDGLAASKARQVQRVRRQRSSTRWARTRSASGWSVGLDTTDATFSCHDAPAAAQDPPLHQEDPRGRQAGRLGREDDPLGWLLVDAEAPLDAGHGHRRRRGRHGQRPDAEGHPLRDARRDLRSARRSSRR